MATNLRVLLSATAALLVLAGCATNGANVPATAQNSSCPAGSSIPATNANCATPGHSYTGGQVNSTGATTTGGALQLLDPSITVHH